MARSFSGKSGNLTVLGQETEFSGTLEFSDNLVITGKFNGSIKATGYLEIDSSAECNVDEMIAESIIVSGKITGNLNASNRVEMRSGSTIVGDVQTAKLRIDDDVDFQGQVTMLDKEPETDIFSVVTSEYKNSIAK